MFGLSLPTLPFLGNGSDAKDDAPVVLTYEQVEEIGRELDALRDRTVASLGAEDREYIYKIIKAQRGFEVAGRGLMYLGFLPPVWLAAVGALSVSKILDNMEIGHNVMHGQYDWMREPGSIPKSSNGIRCARPTSGVTRTTTCITRTPIFSAKTVTSDTASCVSTTRRSGTPITSVIRSGPLP